MRVWGTIRPVLFGFLLVLATALLSWSQAQKLTLPEILSRLQQAEADARGHSVAYTVTREYQLMATDAQQPNSDVVAEISFMPPAEKDYNIVNAQGGERGTSIVRKVLDRESHMTSHPEQLELNGQNYNFALLGREPIDGHDCYVLQLVPKRRAVELIEGRAWVDAGDFTVRRIAGVTAKSPSVWIKNLNVTVDYGQVNGVWLQTSTKAVADVRFAGPHTLTSRNLDVQVASVNARMQAPRPIRSSRGNRTVTNAAAWMAR